MGTIYKKNIPSSLEDDLKVLGVLSESQADELDELDDDELSEILAKKKKIGADARATARKAKLNYKKNKSKLKRKAKKYKKSAAGKKSDRKRKRITKQFGTAKLKKMRSGGKRVSFASDIDHNANMDEKLANLDSIRDAVFESDSAIKRVVSKFKTIFEICQSRLELFGEADGLDESLSTSIELNTESIEEALDSIDELLLIDEEEELNERVSEFVEVLTDILKDYNEIASLFEFDDIDEDFDIEDLEIDEDDSDIDEDFDIEDLEIDEDEDDLEIDEDDNEEEEDDLDIDEAKSPVKIGDVLYLGKRKGKVTKVMSDMANVDFGKGDVYGITFSRIKGDKIDEAKSPDGYHYMTNGELMKDEELDIEIEEDED